MAAYGYAGAGRKQGKMTVAFNQYAKSIQTTGEMKFRSKKKCLFLHKFSQSFSFLVSSSLSVDSGSGGSQDVSTLEFIQYLSQQTRIVHVTCTSLMQRTRLQYSQFSPLSEVGTPSKGREKRRELIHSV
jgi:hypothetical protein